MRKKGLSRALGLVLAAVMTASLAGCGQSGGASEPAAQTEASAAQTAESTEAAETEGSDTASGEVTTITLYPKDAMLQSGVVGGYKGDILAQYGVALDVWAYSDEKTNAILASGSLPDVMYVTKDNLEIMIESGMVLNLEDYLDQLPNLTGNEIIQTALNYNREYNSAGTGQLYAIPTVVGKKVLEYGVTKNMIAINWEYYKGIGAPEFKDQWELIDVMKQMVEAYPTGDDGIPNYGTYLNAGSDTEYWANITSYLKWFGYEPTNLAYLLETDMVNAEYYSILNEDSKYHEGLEWYNTLYREGLMDPDSINSDRATQKAKVDNGYAMVPSGTLQGYGGYQPVYMPNQSLYQESWNSIYGTDFMIVVNAKSDHIDAALKFINMLADPDAYMQVMCGPEGDLWYEEDGVAYIQDGLAEKVANGEEYFLENGEDTSLWSIPWVIDDTSHPTSYVGPDGEPRAVRFDRWNEVLDLIYNTEQQNEWRDITGYEFFVDQAMANDSYILESDLDYVANFAAIPDDTMKLTLDALRDVVVNASWQMVYAESDEEFDAIWNQMVEDCNGLGAQDVIDWRLQELEKAVEIRDSL